MLLSNLKPTLWQNNTSDTLRATVEDSESLQPSDPNNRDGALFTPSPTESHSFTFGLDADTGVSDDTTLPVVIRYPTTEPSTPVRTSARRTGLKCDYAFILTPASPTSTAQAQSIDTNLVFEGAWSNMGEVCRMLTGMLALAHSPDLTPAPHGPEIDRIRDIRPFTFAGLSFSSPLLF
jgi:hypothetical protein